MSTDNEYTFTFGKHKGERLIDVPPSYIGYLIRSGATHTRPDLQSAIEAFRSRTPSQRDAQLKQIIPEWLYDACRDSLRSRIHESTLEYPESMWEEDLEKMEQLITSKFYLEYPERPSQASFDEFLAKQNEVVRRFVEILEDYPALSGYDASGRLDNRLERKEDMVSDTTWFELKKEYKDEVDEYVDDTVSGKHGEEAWMVARWMVRDKHAERVSGITYMGKGPRYDEDSFWKDETIKLWL
ncbi:hypothetical protein V5O48_014312 [Marasmius crinis-equi]|uniref:Uncharacterized protein n=1 Tax=Marasmius crinis-equi TaxID=585013 RepID=A0ABR3EXL6_9AGAR